MPRPVVLLVNPNLMKPPIAPIGLELAGGAIMQAGYGVLWCDLAFAGDWEAFLQDAVSVAPPMAVAVSVRNLDDAYFASQDFILEKTAQVVRRIRALSGAPIILGGVGFSIAPCEVLEYTGADYGIAGDGETALPALLDCLSAKEPVHAVPGAVFRDDARTIRQNGLARCDISARPAAVRHLADHPRYFAEGGQAGIETKRGCAQRCIYCVEPHAKGDAVFLRAPDAVVREMITLLDRGVDVFHLCDSEFNLPPDHARAVCDAVVRHGVADRVRWYVYASPAPFDRDLARAMARAGCAGVNFGADHADTAMLKRLGRPHSTESIRAAAAAVRDAGMALMFDMLLGSPGETRGSIAAAVEFMRDVNPDRVGLSCGVRVYPHTPLAAFVRRQGPVTGNPHLHGTVQDNDNFLKPVFYVETGVGGDIHRVVTELVAGDIRFLHADPAQLEGNYNYNDNSVLANAIRDGAHGAYWDILRRIGEP